MADDRIPITFSFDPKSKEIRRRKGKSDEIIEDKVVATYDPETQVVIVPGLNFLRLYKQGIITFLAENEMTIRSFQRGDLELDKPSTKAIPPRPKKTKAEGDKTEAVVQWYHDHKPNEFATRYGVLGRYTGPVTVLEPVWRERPVDRLPEYAGEQKVLKEVKNVIVALRKTHLTYTPDECDNWDEEDPEDQDHVGAGRSGGNEGDEE